MTMKTQDADRGELTAAVTEQTVRALWEVRNVIACIPEQLWEKEYSEQPVYKHVYHMLHSLDQWFINPSDPNYREPEIHVPDLNNLDAKTSRVLSRAEIGAYLDAVEEKILKYVRSLSGESLSEKPEGNTHTRLELILGQFRHLHTHMGMLMGWIIAETGEWPAVVGLEHPVPQGQYGIFC